MYKKNSWIVALLMALSFSIFLIGCIEPLAETPPDTATYTEFELTEFNAVGGNDLYQKGWATDGSKNQGKAVKDIGLTVEMLQTAKYLVVEVNDGFPKNNFETIYDSFNADGDKIGDWQQFSNITSASGELQPGYGTREGNTLKLEMAKILKNYAVSFKDKDIKAITLLIQHWGNGGPEACIKSAKLLIPTEKEPFVPVTGITITPGKGGINKDVNLTAVVAPENATEQKVIWSIVGFLPDGDTEWLTIDNKTTASYEASKAALLAKVDFKDVEPSSTSDYSVYPPKPVKSPNVIVATEEGKVKVKAIILHGLEEDGKNFEADSTIDITLSIPYEVPESGTGYFYVDLNEWDTQTPSDAGINSTVPLAVTDPDKITIPFTENNQRVNFKLTADQVAALAALSPGKPVSIIINGVLASGGGDQFRYHIGNALSGLNWNFTNGSSNTIGDNKPIADILTTTLTVATPAASDNNATAEYFILQHRAVAAATIEITSIIIVYDPVPVEVDGTVQYVAVKGKGTTSNAAEVSYITGGYQVAFKGGYGNSYAIFPVDFGTGTLADFAKIEFGFKGISGDVGNKHIKVYAFDVEKPSGAPFSGDYFDTGSNTSKVADYNYEDGTNAGDGKTLMNVSESITGTKPTTSKVWFVITLHADEKSGGVATTFQVTDIKFVKE